MIKGIACLRDEAMPAIQPMDGGTGAWLHEQSRRASDPLSTSAG